MSSNMTVLGLREANILQINYKLQRVRVVDHRISQKSLAFSRYTHKPLDEFVYREGVCKNTDYGKYGPFVDFVINIE